MTHLDSAIESIETEIKGLQNLVDGLRDFRKRQQTIAAAITLPAQDARPHPSPLPQEREKRVKSPTQKTPRGGVTPKPGKEKVVSKVELVRRSVATITEPFHVVQLAAAAGTNIKAAQNVLYQMSHRGDVVDAGRDGVKKLYRRKGSKAPVVSAPRIVPPPQPLGTAAETLAEIKRNMASKRKDEE